MNRQPSVVSIGGFCVGFLGTIEVREKFLQNHLIYPIGVLYIEGVLKMNLRETIQ